RRELGRLELARGGSDDPERGSVRAGRGDGRLGLLGTDHLDARHALRTIGLELDGVVIAARRADLRQHRLEEVRLEPQAYVGVRRAQADHAALAARALERP